MKQIVIKQSGISTLIIALNNSVSCQREAIAKQGNGGFQNVNQNQLESAIKWLGHIEAATVAWKDCELQ